MAAVDHVTVKSMDKEECPDEPESDDEMQLCSQQILTESMNYIDHGMQFEKAGDLETALSVYGEGISLLREAEAMETNEEAIPVIAANIESVQHRVDAIRETLQSLGIEDVMGKMQEIQRQTAALRASIDNIHFDENICDQINVQTDSKTEVCSEEEPNDDEEVTLESVMANLYREHYSMDFEDTVAFEQDADSEIETTELEVSYSDQKVKFFIFEFHALSFCKNIIIINITIMATDSDRFHPR